jgi:DNA-binding response OmpR family regulator
MSHPRLLLADEDQVTRAFLQDNLTADGYHVDTAEDRNQAIKRLRTTTPDLIVADVNGKTLGLLDWLRGADSALCAAATDTPVIVLTSSVDELHRVRLLERGGDDVIVKPFSYPELRARIAAVLRRTAPRQPRPVLSAGPVRIDLRDRSVAVDDRLVELSAVEYRLLCQLAGEPTRVFTREELMRDVWGCHSAGRTRTLDSHACRLRAKLSYDTHRLVINVWGVGYRLIDGELR